MTQQDEARSVPRELVACCCVAILLACVDGGQSPADTGQASAPAAAEAPTPASSARGKSRSHSHLSFGGSDYPGLTTAWVDEVLGDHPPEAPLHTGGHVHFYQPPMPDSVRRLALLQVSREARAFGGLWRHFDREAELVLDLEFTRFVGEVRSVEHLGLFLMLEFRRLASQDEPYVLDFWVSESAGEMKVTGARVIARPEPVGAGFELKPLYERDTLRSTALPEKGEPRLVPRTNSVQPESP